MSDSSAQYIHMVQHLIEECIIFKMNREECMEALSKHANIQPIITSTVWKELEKENKEFFEAYNKTRVEKSSSILSAESQLETTRQRIHNMLLDSSSKDSNEKVIKQGDKGSKVRWSWLSYSYI
ncbi:uncharacterized protein LOC107815870 [Nicotiana tabacum]|uniref:Uncharacterized protein LOC107815870 n=2 Tax=Nicotiana TaxID=4085 RepID=A0A1S4C6Y7_TOBAC|nr:PREDICTED: uncharacterized protein LOC104238596 [Nicotiana sylvestris]XP_016497002.1 PREDICTED: uncharacterized protein LOC107815870 [Nicotiana tabacum]